MIVWPFLSSRSIRGCSSSTSSRSNGDVAPVEHAVLRRADVDERRLHAGQHVLHPPEVDVAVDRRVVVGRGADVVLDQAATLEDRDVRVTVVAGRARTSCSARPAAPCGYARAAGRGSPRRGRRGRRPRPTPRSARTTSSRARRAASPPRDRRSTGPPPPVPPPAAAAAPDRAATATAPPAAPAGARPASPSASPSAAGAGGVADPGARARCRAAVADLGPGRVGEPGVLQRVGGEILGGQPAVRRGVGVVVARQPASPVASVAPRSGRLAATVPGAAPAGSRSSAVRRPSLAGEPVEPSSGRPLSRPARRTRPAPALRQPRRYPRHRGGAGLAAVRPPPAPRRRRSRGGVGPAPLPLGSGVRRGGRPRAAAGAVPEAGSALDGLGGRRPPSWSSDIDESFAITRTLPVRAWTLPEERSSARSASSGSCRAPSRSIH